MYSEGGNNPLSAREQHGEVLNLGTVRANRLYIEGKNVTVLDTDKVTDAGGTPLENNAVTIRSGKCPRIGYRVSEKINRPFLEGGVMVNHEVYDYDSTIGVIYEPLQIPGAKASASAREWSVVTLTEKAWYAFYHPGLIGGSPKKKGRDYGYDYMIVDDIYNLQHINDSARMLGELFILDRDIDATGFEGYLPVGGARGFSGNFDGAFHTIRGLRIINHDLEGVGIFGCAWGSIENLSAAGGYVEGKHRVGGIVGSSSATLRNLRNANEVRRVGSDSGYGGVGGILGYGYGEIENVYNEGAVRGLETVGGIVGYGDGIRIYSAANTGRVSVAGLGGEDDITGENRYAGGIAGALAGGKNEVVNAYNTGDVRGYSKVGGIVGTVAVQGEASGDGKHNWIEKIYNTGRVSSVSDSTVGSLAGEIDATGRRRCYIRDAVWKEGTGSRAVGHIYPEAEEFVSVRDLLRTEAEMKRASTYDNWTWGGGGGESVVPAEGGEGKPWRIYEGQTMPLLTGLMQGVKYITSTGGTKVYDGTPFATGEAHILLPAEAKNVGTHRPYSDQFGYDLVGDGAYTITPRKLTLDLKSSARFDKTYDGTKDTRPIEYADYTLTNFVAGEGAGIALAPATGTYETKNVRANQSVSFAQLKLTGEGAGNYVLDKTVLFGRGDIRQRDLTPAIKQGVRFDKEYDGRKTARALTQNDCTMTGLVAGDSVALSGTGEYQNKNAGTHSVTYTGLAITGTDAGNYKLQRSTLRGMGEIARAKLTIKPTSGTYFTKEYDGTA